uniref:Uncharacterized protein n=1 Tax=Leviviridae sp. TaxID=2027243 RepID=A0A514D3G0_9VIRU|nr:MAG: hypothetical protein H2Bulk361016_000002 [Leviviridae sp.]
MSKKPTFRVHFFPSSLESQLPERASGFTGLSFWNDHTLRVCQEAIETGSIGRGGRTRYRAVLDTWLHYELSDTILLHRTPADFLAEHGETTIKSADLLRNRRKTFEGILIEVAPCMERLGMWLKAYHAQGHR